jgi:spectinomycin phosphotransferase
MLEPPSLADSAILAALRAHYGIAGVVLTFLPIGNDSASFVYRVDAADGASYFLKARSGAGFSVSSLTVPFFLHNQGIPHVLAPLPTDGQALWIAVDGFALSLHPFVDAHTATDAGLTLDDWRALGATLRQIHASKLPVELAASLPQETFMPSRRHVVGELADLLGKPVFDDPLRAALVEFWRDRQDLIQTVIERADRLGAELRREALPRVLCHSDLHTWNVLVDAGRQMWIVDWDEVILAPKERDLMFMIGGIGRGLVKPAETVSFLDGYGAVPIDSRALVYYRFAWAVQDMAAYAEQVFFARNAGEPTRRAAMQGFVDLFELGNIVDIALAGSDWVRGV